MVEELKAAPRDTESLAGLFTGEFGFKQAVRDAKASEFAAKEKASGTSADDQHGKHVVLIQN
jgi:hypothetical protein